MSATYNLPALRDELRRDEGSSLKPYRCSVGKITIGIGRNLEDVGISQEEENILFEHDIERSEKDLDRNIPWWRGLSDGRQRAMLNMVFNMGWPRLSKFHKCLAAMKAGDYDTAAAEALNSKWADQVGSRAYRIAQLIREG